MNWLKQAGILPWVIGAIIAGILCGLFFPDALGRVFFTFNDIFSQFLGFAIPLIIVGLIVPAIADLGKGAGKWLGVTAAIAYASTLFSGFVTFFAAKAIYPSILSTSDSATLDDPSASSYSGFIQGIEIPPVFGVMTALILSFVVGIGLSLVPRGVLRKGFVEFREIVTVLISKVIVPLLPLHIFGIFLNLTMTGKVTEILSVLLKVVILVLVLEVVILAVQYGVAGAIAKVNPFKAFTTMLPAYFTALGTSSSAATIPVTHRQTLKNGVSDDVASFVIPLCATIHLSGSTSKITAFAMAIIAMNALPVTTVQLVGFIFMLGIIMIAAPGVPGGAIMASVGILETMLGFNAEATALMIATYIALDSFGTATNVTGDGAIALIINKMAGRNIGTASEGARGFADKAAFDSQSYLKTVEAPESETGAVSTQ